MGTRYGYRTQYKFFDYFQYSHYSFPFLFHREQLNLSCLQYYIKYLVLVAARDFVRVNMNIYYKV